MNPSQKNTAVDLNPELHRALQRKSAATNRPISDLVDEAVRVALVEDSEDLLAFDERAAEPDLVFAEVVEDLKRRDKI